MSLNVFYSNRIEDLAEHLRRDLLAERARTGADPFDFIPVMVPNTNIAKWLQIRVLAREKRLCAGIDFPFMEHELTRLLAAELPEGERFTPLAAHAYAVAVMKILLDPPEAQPEFARFAPFRAYVAGAEGAASPLAIASQRQARMGWQLADRLASLMDQYEVRRPEIVRRWLAGEGEARPGSIEAAEAALARALWGRRGVFPAAGERKSLRQLFERVKERAPGGEPRKLRFFGFSTLSLLQVEILAWLARTHEVVFYHNNVCLEYWGDIEDRRERLRRLGRANAEQEDLAVENPLLRQWGTAGRETMRLLVEFEEANDTIPFQWTCIADPEARRPATVLETVQDAISRRTGETERLPQDASLQIVGAPGIRREVEMVYQSILGSVWKPEGSGERPWSDCGFSEIAVLVPDMATYRPMIEAVFDAGDQIPYSLIDTAAAGESRFLEGFLALVDLARRGPTRETLFALLENPCVQQALGFSDADAAAWRELTAKTGVFEGFDDPPDGSDGFDWAWGLLRLRLAQVAERLPLRRDEPEEEIPLAEAGDASALRFSEVVEGLVRRAEAVFNRGGVHRRLLCAVDPAAFEAAPNWARILRQLMNDLLAIPGEQALESDVRRQIVLTLNGLADIAGEQDYEFAAAAVEQFVGGLACRRGGYLTHGVTIAGMAPMRPVPFKQVYVLGLGEGGFPGRTRTDTLDIRGTGWRLGDTTAPKVNRFLFLETLMAVRERLVLSYSARDIEKDAELFPAGIVRELETFVGEQILEEGPFRECRAIPLLERGEPGLDRVSDPVADVVWRADDPFAGLVTTYSALARRIAAHRAVGGAPPDAFPKAPPEGIAGKTFAVHDLAEFLRSPLRAALLYRFGIAREMYRDQSLEAAPPLGVPGGPVEWALQDAWLEGDYDRAFRKMQLSGQVPTGYLGDFARAAFIGKAAEKEAEIRAFLADFGGEKRRETVSLAAAGGHATFTCEVSNWGGDEDETTVWVTGVRGENAPPVRALEPFLAFLVHIAGAEDRERARELRLGVVDLRKVQTEAWRWSVTPEAAADYLCNLARSWLAYLSTADEAGRYIDFTYLKLAKTLGGARPDRADPDAFDWAGAAIELAKEDAGYSGDAPPARDLVIDDRMADFRRDPSAEELKALYFARYEQPLSAKGD